MKNVGEFIRPSKLKIDANESLSEAFSKMLSNGITSAPVFQDGKFAGILTFRAVLRGFTTYANAKVKNFLEEFVPKLKPDDGLVRAAKLMYESSLSILPVYYEGQLAGFVNAGDVIGEFFNEGIFEGVKASDIFTKAVTLTTNDTLGKALHIMREMNIKQIPVVDSSRKLQGIITLEGLIEKYFIHATPKRELFTLKGQEPEAKSMFEIKLIDLMEEAKTIQYNESITSIKQDIITLKSFVVVKEKRVEGIIATKNVLAFILSASEEKKLISISGMPELSDFDREIIIDRIEKFYEKIDKLLEEKPELNIRFKEYRTSGMRKKHEISARIVSGKYNLQAKTSDWNLLTALEEALDVLIKQLRTEKERK